MSTTDDGGWDLPVAGDRGRATACAVPTGPSRSLVFARTVGLPQSLRDKLPANGDKGVARELHEQIETIKSSQFEGPRSEA